jgi:ligand-binding SRPBCC domain-containing protein
MTLAFFWPMFTFRYSSAIQATVETVWHFHERPDAVQLLIPPWQPVKVLSRSGGLQVGAKTEFLISIGPVPVKWVAVHTECDPYRMFTDIQQEGLVESWTHRHYFVEDNGQTQLTDEIECQLPGGWLAEAMLQWWVRDRLRDMFRYRHQITRESCEADR